MVEVVPSRGCGRRDKTSPYINAKPCPLAAPISCGHVQADNKFFITLAYMGHIIQRPLASHSNIIEKKIH